MGKKLTNQEVVSRCVSVHGEKYNYSLLKYKDYDSKVTIVCKNHGKFKQTPHAHLEGQGCPSCGFNKATQIHFLSNEEFLLRAHKVHGCRYQYVSTYQHQLAKIEIFCSIHGNFKQLPKYHLRGHGCPKCRESKGEVAIRHYLNQRNYNFHSQYIFEDCKFVNPLPFDFYIPSLNVCIEYDGIQHFKAIEKWGGEQALLNTQTRDSLKTTYCQDRGIRLLRINYKEDILLVLQNSSIFTVK